MRVLVLGSGVDALLAAHAAALRGHDIDIVGSNEKEELLGNPILPIPVPMAAEKPSLISFLGDDRFSALSKKAQVSARFQFTPNNDWEGGNSYFVTSARKAYDWLWATYGRFVDAGVSISTVMDFVFKADNDVYDAVISAVPAPSICANPAHSFPSDRVMGASADSFVKKRLGGLLLQDHSGIFMCNGRVDTSWFRMSLLDDNCWMEWPADAKPIYVPISERRSVVYPALTTCDCWPNILKVGREGRWKSEGHFVSNVFGDVLYYLEEMEQKGEREQRN